MDDVINRAMAMGNDFADAFDEARAEIRRTRGSVADELAWAIVKKLNPQATDTQREQLADSIENLLT